MTDIPPLIERLRKWPRPDCPLPSEAIVDIQEAAEALSVSPLPDEIAGLIGRLLDPNTELLAAGPTRKTAAAALERMAREIERVKLQTECGFCNRPFGKFGGICESCHAARIRALEYERDRFQALWRQADDRAYELQKRIRELEAERDETRRLLRIAIELKIKYREERDAIKAKVAAMLDLLDQGGLPEDYQVRRLEVAALVGYEPASKLQRKHDTEFVDAIKTKTINECLLLIPAGNRCDPQAIADSIRGLIPAGDANPSTSAQEEA